MSEFNYQEFMKHLHQQASGGDDAKRKDDKKLMEAFGNFIMAGTEEYRGFIAYYSAGEAGYLGHHAKKAGINKDFGWEWTESFLKSRYGLEDVSAYKTQYDAGYELGIEDTSWRKRLLKKSW